MPKIQFAPATAKQQEYIEQLSIDLQFDRKQRNAHCSVIIGRNISYLDAITKDEASQIITVFKQWKDSRKDF